MCEQAINDSLREWKSNGRYGSLHRCLSQTLCSASVKTVGDKFSESAVVDADATAPGTCLSDSIAGHTL